MDSKPIQELDRYIRENYKGRISEALESIGGVRLVRAVLGWPDHAVMDHRLYEAPPEEKNA